MIAIKLFWIVLGSWTPLFSALNLDNFNSEFWTAKYHDHVKNYDDQTKNSGQPSFAEFVPNYMTKSDCGISDQNKFHKQKQI